MKKLLKIVLTAIACWLYTLPALAVQLSNPLGDNQVDPRVIVGNVIKGALGLVGTIALALFIWGGFKILISQGAKEKYKQGTDIMLWAAIGMAVIFGSYGLVNFLITKLQ